MFQLFFNTKKILEIDKELKFQPTWLRMLIWSITISEHGFGKTLGAD